MRLARLAQTTKSMKYERPTKTISRESFPRRRCCFLSQQQIKGKAVSNTNSSVGTQRAKKKGPVLANEASEDSGNPNELDKMLRQQLRVVLPANQNSTAWRKELFRNGGGDQCIRVRLRCATSPRGSLLGCWATGPLSARGLHRTYLARQPPATRHGRE